MTIQCDCGQFQAELSNFPKNTPGRSVCYCDDCQTYLHYLKRTDLLDEAGGTEIIPMYPADIKIISGQKNIKITRLLPTGMFRMSTTCCNTPIGNSAAGLPWVGVFSRMFSAKNTSALESKLGPIKIRIMGKFASANPPEGTSAKVSFKDMKRILPFMLKGFLFGKKKPSMFFKEDGKTSIEEPHVLSLEERTRIKDSFHKKN